MDTIPCTPCCSTVQTVNTPGTQGPSSVTLTTASFVIPAIGGTIAISVADSSWMVVGKNLFISDGAKFGNFLVTAIGSATGITARYLGLVGDSAAGGTIANGAIIVPGKGNDSAAWDLDALTAFTDNSGGTKSDTIAVSVTRSVIQLGPFLMTAVVNSQLWEMAIPFAFNIVSVNFRCDIAMTSGGSAAAVLTTRINGTPTTGGVVTLAGAYATGATQAGTAVTVGSGTAGQTVESILSGVTAWSAGYGHLEVTLTNADLAATISALAFKANQLRTALRHQ